MAVWRKIPRRWHGAGIVCIIFALFLLVFNGYEPTPKAAAAPIAQETTLPTFNSSSGKVALLIEDRPLPNLVPLFLHFMTVLPPEWSFQFIGSGASITALTSSPTIKHHVLTEKVKIASIPSGTSIKTQELISRFMTTRWLWESVIAPAYTVLVFQTDSIICANSRYEISEFLEWDWIGSPWRRKNRIGGNGGLSLRKVKPILEILRKEERVPDSEFEDVWFTERLQKMEGVRIADRATAMKWSGDSQLPDEYLEGVEETLKKGETDPRTKYEPMGYHIGFSGNGDQYHQNLWGSTELREHVWQYCPEVKMLFAMDPEEYVPGNCHSTW